MARALKRGTWITREDALSTEKRKEEKRLKVVPENLGRREASSHMTYEINDFVDF